MAEAFSVVDVRVFDGRELTAPVTVTVRDGVIEGGPGGGRVVDARGAVLLPGLIDAHVHVRRRETLDVLARHGVTTALDMASWPPELPDSLRRASGTTDLRSAGLPAIGPGGRHAKLLGLPEEAIVTEPAAAEGWVAARVAEGSDYIKVILEAPGQGGPGVEVARALVEAAHRHGKQVVAHAASPGAYTMAIDAGADVVTHAPLGMPAGTSDVERTRVAVPTLTMMRAIASFSGRPEGFAAARATVEALHRAGVPILAGTDANDELGDALAVPYGTSLHDELALLVEAGLSTAAALRAATSLPARHFGLADRGVIAPGLRADLLLIDGDPLADITATRNVLRVWCAGVERS
ncbi:amidohydrolase family protein [Nonomuraea salmonea]|uniref:Amidohydrolase family protein n=1 Tax=Nonomuraea salmonea TaxID=46181 RepID=A0ABV5NCF2_9ACTN